MSQMRLAVVLGTRPELIKLAPLIQYWHQHSPQVDLEVWLTGQHKEMLDGLIDLFDLGAVNQLNLDYKSANLTQLTGDLLKQLDSKFLKCSQPDAVIIQGDTTTCLATALTCFYNGIPVAHVEAGLRTYDLSQPYPEELNRQIVSKLSHWHFCPTEVARQNLLKEGVPDDQIEATGNTVIDALQFVLSQKINAQYETKILKEESPQLARALSQFQKMKGRSLSLLTLHRRESQGAEQASLFQLFRRLAEQYEDHHWVLPCHLNPNVRSAVFRYLQGLDNFHLVEPLSYRPFLYLMNRCDFVLTDSGGLQEELPSLKKPFLILRQTTERPEVVDQGFGRLVGTSPREVERGFQELLQWTRKGQTLDWFRSEGENPFGDGHAAEKICRRLELDLAKALPDKKAA